MKIKLLAIGKTDDKNIVNLIEDYKKRLNHYINFEFKTLPDIKNSKKIPKIQQKNKEGALILSKIKSTDFLILLDDKGVQYSSIEFSKFLQKKMNSGINQIIILIGGPYGFSDEVYKKAKLKISLSKMTFSHQMIRIFIIEQLYRGYTILRNEPYHNE